MPAWPLPVVALGVAVAMTTLVWLASLAKRDASIIDVFWGLGFVLLGWVYFAAGDGNPVIPQEFLCLIFMDFHAAPP